MSRGRTLLLGTLTTAATVAATPGAAVAGAAPTEAELRSSVQPLVPVVDPLRPGPSDAMRTRSAGTAALEADVLFDFDRARVRPAGRRAVLRLADGVVRRGGTLRVIGFTDGVGGTAYNRRLSLRRARAVAAVLRPALPAGVRVRAEGRGAEDPVAPETTADGDDDPAARARNRRVELRTGSG